MGVTITPYNSFLKYTNDGTINLVDDDIKVLLVTSDYTFDSTHDVLADVLSSPSPEVEEVVSPDNGYTQGGELILGSSVDLVDSPLLSTWDANDVTWALLTATFRYGIIYKDGEANGITNPLIACILFDDTPADKSPSGVSWTIKWASTGIATFGIA